MHMISSSPPTNDLRRAVGLYVFLFLVTFIGIFYTLREGQTLKPRALTPGPSAEIQPATQRPPVQSNTSSSLITTLERNSTGALSRLFLQIAAIVGAAWALGKVFERFSQPMV